MNWKTMFEEPCDEQRIRQTVRRSIQAFGAAESEKTMTDFEFLAQQSRYIRKRWWAAQAGLLLALLALLCRTDSGFMIGRSLGAAAPLFAVLLLPEIWKSRASDAMEVECSTFYSLRQIYAARMLSCALVDLVMLSLFAVGACCLAGVSFPLLLVQFFLPYSVTCCICFRTLYSRACISETFALLLCFIWAVIWLQIVLHDALYCAISMPVWCALLALSMFYLAHCIRSGQRNCSNWEAKVQWN